MPEVLPRAPSSLDEKYRMYLNQAATRFNAELKDYADQDNDKLRVCPFPDIRMDKKGLHPHGKHTIHYCMKLFNNEYIANF